METLDLKSGDVVLFSGKGWLSRLIQLATFSPYSHVGLVVKEKKGRLLLWESTTLSNLPDLSSGKHIRGVQTVDLKERVSSYEGKVAVRHLKKPLTRVQRRLYDAFREKVVGMPYEKSKVTLVRSAVDLISGQKEDLSSLFCSEMVAEAYQEMLLISEDKSSSEYTPADFQKEMEDVLGDVIKIK